MDKFLFSKKDILSGVAKWGVAQSPYHRPDFLEIVLDKLNNKISEFFQDENNYFLKMSYQEIKDFVFKHTTSIPEFLEWNEPKKSAGENFIASSSRFHTTKPEYDYIDLHALSRNVANDILWESEGAKKSIPSILNRADLSSN